MDERQPTTSDQIKQSPNPQSTFLDLSEWERIVDERVKNPGSLATPDINLPTPDVKDELVKQHLMALLRQRNRQREFIFKSANHYTRVSLLFLITVVFVQVVGRIVVPNHDFQVFDGSELNWLITGVFAQIIGLLYIITRALYDEKDYKELYQDTLKH